MRWILPTYKFKCLKCIAVPSILSYIDEANDAVLDANIRTAKSEIGLLIATENLVDATGAGAPGLGYDILVDEADLNCTWTPGDFPTAFTCTEN